MIYIWKLIIEVKKILSLNPRFLERLITIGSIQIMKNLGLISIWKQTKGNLGVILYSSKLSRIQIVEGLWSGVSHIEKWILTTQAMFFTDIWEWPTS